jgi:hypothetical protein
MRRLTPLWRHCHRHPIDSVASLVIFGLIAWALWSCGQWILTAANW